MGLYEYHQSGDIARQGYSVDSLLMAAIRMADSTNSEKLREGWPELWAEVNARYHAPGGRLPEDGPVPS